MDIVRKTIGTALFLCTSFLIHQSYARAYVDFDTCSNGPKQASYTAIEAPKAQSSHVPECPGGDHQGVSQALSQVTQTNKENVRSPVIPCGKNEATIQNEAKVLSIVKSIRTSCKKGLAPPFKEATDEQLRSLARETIKNLEDVLTHPEKKENYRTSQCLVNGLCFQVEGKEGYITFQKICEPIGKGKFKTVWSGYDYNHSNTIAYNEAEFKSAAELLSEKASFDVPQSIEKILKDSGVSSSGIVKSYSVMGCKQGDHYHLYGIQPFYPQGTLEEFHSSDIKQIKRMSTDLIQALEQVHRSGYVHRDIKPDNVLIDEEGKAILADFGLASQGGVTQHQVVNMALIPFFTKHRILRKTPSFDQLKAMDIFNLGNALYYLIQGDYHPGVGEWSNFRCSSIVTAISDMPNKSRINAVLKQLPPELGNLTLSQLNGDLIKRRKSSDPKELERVKLIEELVTLVLDDEVKKISDIYRETFKKEASLKEHPEKKKLLKVVHQLMDPTNVIDPSRDVLQEALTQLSSIKY